MNTTDILGPHPVQALPARDDSRANLVDLSDYRDRARRLFGASALDPLPDPPCDVEEGDAA